MFSSVSFINGRIGLNHTIVGIPASFNFCKTSNRSDVVDTAGSKTLQSSSSYVVIVISTTHFDFSFISLSRSISLNILDDFVWTLTPNPYLLIIS